MVIEATFGLPPYAGIIRAAVPDFFDLAGHAWPFPGNGFAANGTSSYAAADLRPGPSVIVPNNGLIVPRAAALSLMRDIRTAFELPNTTRLSSDKVLHLVQCDLLRRIALSPFRDARVEKLLEYMRARLGGHFYHGLRVAVMHLDLIANFFGPTAVPARTLYAVGLLHDCGKLIVPDNILFKNGSLSPEETDIMHRHNLATYCILAPLEDKFPHLGEVAAFHHPYRDR